MPIVLKRTQGFGITKPGANRPELHKNGISTIIFCLLVPLHGRALEQDVGLLYDLLMLLTLLYPDHSTEKHGNP
jgi:hypothetical protein